jgi:hypothetical protein
VRLKRHIKNRAYLKVPKCTPDSLEISVIKIDSLKRLNHVRSRTKKYYNYSNYTSITYTTLGHFYRHNQWHSALNIYSIYVLLKKTKITPFKELFWKIKIQQRKEMLSINNKIPRVKKSGHLLPVLPLIPQKTTKMEEEKGRFIAFDLKTRVGQSSDATKYKKYVRKFEEGTPKNG